jgi:hypothetical protein
MHWSIAYANVGSLIGFNVEEELELSRRTECTTLAACKQSKYNITNLRCTACQIFVTNNLSRTVVDTTERMYCYY